MQAISDVIANRTERTEARRCEQHGDYECRILWFGSRDIATECPDCQQGREAERERAERDEREAAHRAHVVARIGIPRRFADATMAGYQPPTERAEKVLAACRRYVETWPERADKGSSLILSGGVGTGKTHLACAIAKGVAIKYDAHAGYMTVAQAIRRIRATYNPEAKESEQEAFDRLSALDLLVLDEVGIQSGSNHEHATLFEIINRRYESVLPTIVISNLGAKELSAAIGERLVDRLRENGAVLTFAWDSHRGAA
jgi:DNA replication protein DnaC